MPALSRIDYVVSQISMGRRAHISIGEAHDSTKMKLKIVMESASSGPISTTLAATLIAFLNSIRATCQSYTVTDRGHGYSSGKAEICFWMSKHSEDDATLLPPPAPPCLPVEHAPSVLDPAAPEFAPSRNEQKEETAAPDQEHMQEHPASRIVGSSSLSNMATSLGGMVASSRSDLEAICQQLDVIEQRNAASGSNVTCTIASASFADSAAASAAGSVAEAPATEQHTAPTSPYNAEYLERLRNAGISKDDKAINLFLNKHGDIKSVIDSLQGLERYFHDRLNIISAFLAKQVGLPPPYGSSWVVLKSAVLTTLEEEEFRSSTSTSLGYVLHHISKQSPPSSPEKVQRKTRRKK